MTIIGIPLIKSSSHSVKHSVLTLEPVYTCHTVKHSVLTLEPVYTCHTALWLALLDIHTVSQTQFCRDPLFSGRQQHHPMTAGKAVQARLLP